MKSLFEQNGGTFCTVNGYKIPNLTISAEESVIFGKYALLRKRYLKQHRRILYTHLLTSGTLNQHLTEIERTANERMEQQMAVQQGVTEQLKAADQMKWVGLRQTADEIICKELIYS